MYEEHFGFAARPFRLLPDPAVVFWSPQHRRAYDALCLGLARLSPLTVVTGAVGAGKTTLLRTYLDDAPDDVRIGLISNFTSGAGDILHWVLMAFDIACDSDTPVGRFRAFEAFCREARAAGTCVVLILDEAQNASDADLERLRLLSNLNDTGTVLMLVLVGQPALEARLAAPTLRQLRQRVGVEARLGPLSAGETVLYVRHRLARAGGRTDIFDAEALTAIHAAAEGVPRVINSLADLCLLIAFGADATRVDGALAAEAIAEARTARFLALPQAGEATVLAEAETRAEARAAAAGRARRSRPSPLRPVPAGPEDPVLRLTTLAPRGTEAAPSEPRETDPRRLRAPLTAPSAPVRPANTPHGAPPIARSAPPQRPLPPATDTKAPSAPPAADAPHPAPTGKTAAEPRQPTDAATPFEPPAEAPRPAAAEAEAERPADKAEQPLTSAEALSLDLAEAPAPAVSGTDRPERAAEASSPAPAGKTEEPPAAVDADRSADVATPPATAEAPHSAQAAATAEAERPADEAEQPLTSVTGSSPDPAAAPAPAVSETDRPERAAEASSPAPAGKIEEPPAAVGADRPAPAEVLEPAAAQGPAAERAAAAPGRRGWLRLGQAAAAAAALALLVLPAQRLLSPAAGPERVAAIRAPAAPAQLALSADAADEGGAAGWLLRGVDLAAGDPAAAAIAYARAALRGSGRAADYLGQIHETGEGVAVDLSAARAWYEVASADIAGAARRAAALDGVPPAGGPAAPPVVLSADVQGGLLEIVWTSGAGADPQAYRIGLADAGGTVLAEREVAQTAVQVEPPAAAAIWQLTAIFPDGAETASAWYTLPPMTD